MTLRLPDVSIRTLHEKSARDKSNEVSNTLQIFTQEWLDALLVVVMF